MTANLARSLTEDGVAGLYDPTSAWARETPMLGTVEKESPPVTYLKDNATLITTSRQIKQYQNILSLDFKQ